MIGGLILLSVMILAIAAVEIAKINSEKCKINNKTSLELASIKHNTNIEIAEIQYGEPRRQDKLESKLNELLERFKNADSDKIDLLRQEVNTLKIKVGFR